ncbi:MAG TPA: hypothetical protein VK430_05310 [Xanthobacteraceae bacterium]|nr:hypothetical protein [Xanthobacteraceae bacterium]
MKLISFSPALLAVVGIVLQPIAPAYAVTADEPITNAVTHAADLRGQPALIVGQTLDEYILDAQISRKMREKLAYHAGQGEAAILSRAQMDDLARTHPTLHAKLTKAHRTLSVPHLTAAEKKLVAQMTADNLAAFKAGVEECGLEVGAASPVKVATTGGSVPCPSANTGNNLGGLWVFVALIAVLLTVPFFCTLFGNPPFCRGQNAP